MLASGCNAQKTIDKTLVETYGFSMTIALKVARSGVGGGVLEMRYTFFSDGTRINHCRSPKSRIFIIRFILDIFIHSGSV